MPKVRMQDGTVIDVAADALLADDGTTPFTASLSQQATGGRFFTEEDVARIRAEEKDKVYGRLEAVQQELQAFKDQVGSLTAAEQRREAQLKEEQDRLEAEARQKEAEELDAKSLLQKREQEWREQQERLEQEWNSRFESIEAEKEQERALREKERQFNDLKDYAQAQVSANEDKIAPQLRNFIGGNSREEIDASIARAIEATEGILAEMQQALPQTQQAFQQDISQQAAPVQQFAPAQPPAVPGTRSTAPVGQDPAVQFQTLTQEQIANMPMDQYAKLRGQLGIGGQSQSRGLFG